MRVTLKLYMVTGEPGPAIRDLNGMPLGSIASTYILARTKEHGRKTMTCGETFAEIC